MLLAESELKVREQENRYPSIMIHLYPCQSCPRCCWPRVYCTLERRISIPVSWSPLSLSVLPPKLLADCVLKVKKQENRYPSIMINLILVILPPMLLADLVMKVREQKNKYPSIMITFILVSLAPDVAGWENLLLEEICPAPRFRDLATLTQVCKPSWEIYHIFI